MRYSGIRAVVLLCLWLRGISWASESSERGSVLYAKYCATCHGSDGRGEGSAAIYLSPKPRDFTRGIFKFQSTPAGSLPTDQDLLRTLLKGMPGSAMPSWDRLTDRNRVDLIEYIKTLSPRFSSEKPVDVLEISNEPPRTSEMVEDGKAVYALASCWSCHGKNGTGDGPSAGTLTDDFGRAIRPYNFTRAGAFKGGGSPKDIYRTFSTGVGGTPMPGYGEDALLFGREDFGDMANLAGIYTDTELQGIRDFVSKLPARAEIDRMDVSSRKRLADRTRWSLVYYVLSLSNPSKTQISYTTKDHPVLSQLVGNVVSFSDPASKVWQTIAGEELPLISLWQRDSGTDRVLVQSVTDGTSIAFRLEWQDETKDDQAIYQSKFGDAAAVQFSLNPANDPFFGMGDTTSIVNVWHWKSWWQTDLDKFVGVNNAFRRNALDFYPFDVAGGSREELFVNSDSAKALSRTWNAGWGSGNLISSQERKSAVEDLDALGFGTLTSQGAAGQNVFGRGAWNDRRWAVVFTRALASKEPGDVVLNAGSNVPVAFAVWDGALGDRNGQKMVTNWYRLTVGGK